jgi:hypothetical protein
MSTIERLYRRDRGRKFLGSARNKAIVLYSLKRVLEKQGFALDDARDNKSCWSQEELFQRLEEYGKLREFRVSSDVWNWAYKRTLRTFGCRGEKLKPLFAEEELRGTIKPDKSAGLPTLGKKGEVFRSEYRRMLRIREDKCAPPPCMAFHRVQHGDAGPKTRLVWGYPLSMTLLEAQFADPLIRTFLRRQTPMAFGYRKADLWARIIPLTRKQRVIALDYSKFDASIHPKLIMMAFTVLGTWFTAEDKRKGRWDKIVHYFIHTPIVMPDGYVYRKHQGVPSGSFFTQLVDSIVNYFLLQCIAARMGLKLDVLVLGDDSLIAVEPIVGGCYDLFKEGKFALSMVRGFLSSLGITVNVDKSHYYVGNDRQAVHFLGHVWSRGYPHRQPRDIARRAVYPERFYRGMSTDELTRQRVLMLLGDAVESWKLFRDYLQPSRHGVCLTTGYGVRNSAETDIGWYRALQSVGVVVKINRLPYCGLMT